MTETLSRQRLRKLRFEGGTLRDRSNFENMQRIIIELEDEVRALSAPARSQPHQNATIYPAAPRRMQNERE